ncbi:MAG TPA: GNAT family N-acetyltransferase [Balneolales bacterium]|nr:GNAT family N-acetyltransferase [Balneolales bacterium]
MIRLATHYDLAVIDRIYNQAIDRGFQTAQTTPLNNTERIKWYEEHSSDKYPVYVFEQDHKVLGWASLSPYRPGREALKEVAEISFYVNSNTVGQGIGSQLMEYCLENASTLKKRIYFAILIEGNLGSLRLLKKYGFERWGYLPEVIHFRGERKGQIYMGKILDL